MPLPAAISIRCGASGNSKAMPPQGSLICSRAPRSAWASQSAKRPPATLRTVIANSRCPGRLVRVKLRWKRRPSTSKPKLRCWPGCQSRRRWKGFNQSVSLSAEAASRRISRAVLP